MFSRLHIQHRMTAFKFRHALNPAVQKFSVKAALHPCNHPVFIKIHKGMLQIVEMLNIKSIIEGILDDASSRRRLQNPAAGWAFPTGSPGLPAGIPKQGIADSLQCKGLRPVIAQVRHKGSRQFFVAGRPALPLLRLTFPLSALSRFVCLRLCPFPHFSSRLLLPPRIFPGSFYPQ